MIIGETRLVDISLGIRIAILFPTFLYYFSVIISYYIAFHNGESGSSANQNKSKTNFFREFYLETYFLLAGNALVLIFEFNLVEIGVLLNFLIGGVFVFAGLITVKSESARTFLLFFLNILIICEACFLGSLGLTIEVFGYSLRPETIALIPIIVVVILFIIVGIFQRRKVKQ